MFNRSDLKFSRTITTISGDIEVECEPVSNGYVLSVSKWIVLADGETAMLDSHTNECLTSFSQALDRLGEYEKLEI